MPITMLFVKSVFATRKIPEGARKRLSPIFWAKIGLCDAAVEPGFAVNIGRTMEHDAARVDLTQINFRT